MFLDRLGFFAADNVTLVVFVLVLAISWIFLQAKWTRNLPPGPWGLPFIGYLPFAERHLSRFAANLAKKYNSDVISVRLGPELFVFLNSFEAIKEAFHNDELTERPESIFFFKYFQKGHGLVFSNGQRWKEQRRFALSVLRDFGMGKKAAEERIVNEIQHLSDEFEKQNNTVIDVAPLFKIASSNIISITAFGKQYAYDDKEFLFYSTRINHIVKLVGYSSVMNIFPVLRYLPGDVVHFYEVQKNIEEILSFLGEQIGAHRAKFDPNNIGDYIDAYLAEQGRQNKTDPDSYSDEDLEWSLFELFSAGVDTTSTTLQWAILYMMKYPNIQKKVQAELDEVLGRDREPTVMDRRRLPYTEATLMETMRLDAVIPIAVPHSNNERDVTFRGYTIPKGAYVHPNLWSVHRDPKIWRNPDEFDPGNFLNEKGKIVNRPELMPFSTGRRQCPGESLARMETFLIFASLLQKFRFSAATWRIRAKHGADIWVDINSRAVQDIDHEKVVASRAY